MDTYNELVDNYFERYLREYGERKMRQLTDKVKSSQKLKKQLLTLSFRAPFKEDIIYPVMNIPYFMFSKRSHVTMGCLLFLHMWNELYNSSEQVLNDYDMHELATSIIFHLRDI
jgi:hypothetical protein